MADLLEADANNKKGIKFDMNTWGHSNNYTRPPAMDCGTTACAMGLAVVSGAFKRAGLFNARNDDEISIALRDKDGWVIRGGIDCAMELFGLSNEQAVWLFLPSSYYHDYRKSGRVAGADGERFVAKRIRNLVETGEVPNAST